MDGDTRIPAPEGTPQVTEDVPGFARPVRGARTACPDLRGGRFGRPHSGRQV